MSYQSIPRPGSSGSSSNSGFQFLNSPFGDTTYTKVFVGGLAWETQSETMRRYFEQFGEILEAVVISDKNTGRSKGYGFVTFRDPSAAQKACSDPSPIIDGRRANCNLASLGRPQPSGTYGHLRSVTPYFGSNQAPSGPYLARSSFQQTAPYSYQQGFAYPTYGYTAYGSEYIYPQGVYNPYMSQQFLQIGAPGTVNPVVYPYGQLTQPPPGTRGYTTFQGYPMPGHHVMQLSGTNSTGVTMTPTGAIQGPYHPGMVAPFPAQPHFIIPAPSPRFAQGSGSDQRQIEG